MRKGEKLQILKLMRELKKNVNWLNQFIIDNHHAPRIEPSLPASQILDKLSDELLAKLLSELSGIKRNCQDKGYPDDFDSIPVPDISASSEEIEIKLNLPDGQPLDDFESQILIHLVMNGKQSASDISRATGIQRAETYNYLSTLLAFGFILSTSDKPLKFYCEPGIASKLTG
jgi:hypothetical protein